MRTNSPAVDLTSGEPVVWPTDAFNPVIEVDLNCLNRGPSTFKSVVFGAAKNIDSVTVTLKNVNGQEIPVVNEEGVEGVSHETGRVGRCVVRYRHGAVVQEIG